MSGECQGGRSSVWVCLPGGRGEGFRHLCDDFCHRRGGQWVRKLQTWHFKESSATTGGPAPGDGCSCGRNTLVLVPATPRHRRSEVPGTRGPGTVPTTELKVMPTVLPANGPLLCPSAGARPVSPRAAHSTVSSAVSEARRLPSLLPAPSPRPPGVPRWDISVGHGVRLDSSECGNTSVAL